MPDLETGQVGEAGIPEALPQGDRRRIQRLPWAAPETPAQVGAFLPVPQGYAQGGDPGAPHVTAQAGLEVAPMLLVPLEQFRRVFIELERGEQPVVERHEAGEI